VAKKTKIPKNVVDGVLVIAPIVFDFISDAYTRKRQAEQKKRLASLKKPKPLEPEN